MMARNSAGSAGSHTPPAWFALTTLLLCCVFFSGLSLAQETAEETAPEAADAPVNVDTELERILAQNNRCLRCHTRDRSKTLEDGQELSLKIHREDFTRSAHGEVACVSCHVSIESRGRHPSRRGTA